MMDYRKSFANGTRFMTPNTSRSTRERAVSSGLELELEFIHYPEELIIGDHYLWEGLDDSSYSGTRLAKVLKEPRDRRLSCLLDENYPFEGKYYYCFIFDLPFNKERPSDAERHFAQNLSYPNILNHLFLIPESSWRSQGIIISKAKSIFNQSFVKCKIEDCLQVGKRYQFLSLCENKFHFCCQSHFIPLGNEALQWTDEMRDYLRQYSQRQFRITEKPLECLETGARYLYFINTCFPKLLQKGKLTAIVAESGSYICPLCHFQSDSTRTICRLDILEHQLKNPVGYLEDSDTEEEKDSQSSPNRTPRRRRDSSTGSEEGNYDFGDSYARKVTKSIRRSNSKRATTSADSFSANDKGLQPTSQTRSLDIDEKGIPFRETAKWNNLTFLTKRRLIEWQSLLESNGYATKEEVESIYREQTRSELEDITLQLLKVLLSSNREGKRLSPSASSGSKPVVKTPSLELYPLGSTVASSARTPILQSNSTRRDSFDRELPLTAASSSSINYLGRGIELRVYQPEFPALIKTIRVFPDLTYDEVLRISCETLQITHINWRSMCLVKKNTDGWNEKIYPEKTYAQNPYFHSARSHIRDDEGDRKEFTLWGMLTDQDYIEVRRTKGAFLGGRFCLQSIADLDHQNKCIQQKITELNENYAGYREIRGDGNCYYRSVFCGVIEYLISLPSNQSFQRKDGFKFLYEKFHSILYYEKVDSHLLLLRILQEASEYRKWLSVSEFEADLLNERLQLDEIAIFNCKKLIADYILLNKGKEFNGINLENAILFTNEKYSNLIDYCQAEVMAMEVCAEGAHVDIGILPALLGTSCEVVYLDREESHQITVRETNGLVLEKEIAKISLLFRPGHYDLLYKRMDAFKRMETPSSAIVSTPQPTPSSTVSKPISGEQVVDRDLKQLSVKEKEALSSVKPSLMKDSPAPMNKTPPVKIESEESKSIPLKAVIEAISSLPVQTDTQSKRALSSPEKSKATSNITEKSSSPVTVPKLTLAEINDLLEVLAENDFRLRLHRQEIKQLLEMGFSLDIILDVWAQSSGKLYLYDDWLERCIMVAERKEREKDKQKETESIKEEKKNIDLKRETESVSVKNEVQQPTTHQEIGELRKSESAVKPSALSSLSSLTMSISVEEKLQSANDFKQPFSGVRKSPAVTSPFDQSRKSQIPRPSMHNTASDFKSPSKPILEVTRQPKVNSPSPSMALSTKVLNNNGNSAKANTLELTAEEKEVLTQAKADKILNPETWKAIEKLSIEIQRETRYPLRDILSVVLKNPFAKSKPYFIEKLQLFSTPIIDSNVMPKKSIADPGSGNIDSSDFLTNDGNRGLLTDTTRASQRISRKDLDLYDATSLPQPQQKEGIVSLEISKASPPAPPLNSSPSPANRVSRSIKRFGDASSTKAVEKDEKKSNNILPLNQGEIDPSLTPKILSPTLAGLSSSSSSPSRVSMLVDKFNQKSAQNSPDKRSDAGSPASHRSSQRIISASGKVTPVALGGIPKPPTLLSPEAQVEEMSGLFELFQAKQRYPGIDWDRAEDEAKKLYSQYHVPMGSIIQAILQNRAFTAESMKLAIEKTNRSILVPKDLPIGTDVNQNQRTKNRDGNYQPDSTAIEHSSSLSSAGKNLEEEKQQKESLKKPVDTSITINPRYSLSRYDKETVQYSADEKASDVVTKTKSVINDIIQSTNSPTQPSFSREKAGISLPIGTVDKLANPLVAFHSSTPNPMTNQISPDYELNFLYKKHQSLFNYLVLDLNLPAQVVRDAIQSFNCLNIRSAIIASKSLITGHRPFFRDLAPREENPVFDNSMKEMIFKTVHEFGYPIDDVLDAITDDRCIVIEDIVDVMESKQILSEKSKQSNAASRKASSASSPIEFLSEDEENQLQRFLEGAEIGGVEGNTLSSRPSDRLAALLQSDYLYQKYPTGDVGRRHSEYPKNSPSSKTNNLSKTESEKMLNSPSFNSKIDIKKLKLLIKQMDRLKVMKELKKRGLMQEKFSGESTRFLRDQLYVNLIKTFNE